MCGLALLWGIPLLITAVFVLVVMLRTIVLGGGVASDSRVVELAVLLCLTFLSSVFALAAADHYGDEKFANGHWNWAISVVMAAALALMFG